MRVREMMKGKKRNLRGLNNKGMSLVEVLIAVAILAVVAAPLLKSFVSATQYNAKAKEKQRLTTAAQSIMEGFKSFDIEELCWQFSGDAAHLFQVHGAAEGYWEIPCFDRDGDGAFDTSILTGLDGVKGFVPSGDNCYEFALKNISFEGKYFDAKVEASPNANVVSEQNLISVESMNGYLDGVYKQQVSQDAIMYGDILSKVLDELNTMDGIYEYELEHLDKDKIIVTKLTTVHITADPSNPDINKVTVESRYDYSVNNYPYFKSDGSEDFFSYSDLVTSSVVNVYDNTDTVTNGAKLENVFLYYYPAYNSSATGAKIASETIHIQNDTSMEKNIYFIKQKNTALSAGVLFTCESSYTPTITGSGAMILHHNLHENLASPGSPVGTVTFSGFAFTYPFLLEDKDEILLFDLNVTIYNQGAADGGFADTPLLEFKGSMNNK